MGVRGLNGFIESNSDFLETWRFRQSKLIIDGSSLFYCLYFRSDSGLDRTHGGDYNYFEERVALFFESLKLCNIEPYVVLDGGTDVRGTKFDTIKKRCQERIKSADALSRGCSGEILPLLIKSVFKQVLQKLGIPFIQCLAEADWEAAALANEWNCPVLSNDSDFYIFSNRGGFLPITHFQWMTVDHHTPAAEQFIPAQYFNFNSLRAKFNDMNGDLLPLFATILGNDYTILDKITFPNFSKFSTNSGRYLYFDGLLQWLSQFSGPVEAIDALLPPMGNNQEADILRTAMNQDMEVYKLKSSSIAQFFINGEPQTRLPGALQNLPDWTLKPLAEGKLASSIIAVLTEQRVIMNFQLEDFGLSSSSNTSQLIRKVMYGILLRTRWQKISKHSQSAEEKHQDCVEEYDREVTTLTSSMVQAVLPRCLETQNLESVWEVPQNLRLQVMLEALGVSLKADVTHVPKDLQLAVYVTCFWLKHANPEPNAEIFWALLTGLVYGHLCREQMTKKEIGPLGLLQKTALDLESAHAYSQWICCLKDSFNLNQLLNQPVPEPELAWLYCGSLVHSLAHKIKSGTEPESFLADAPGAIQLYQNLQAAVEHELDEAFITRVRTRTWQRRHQHQESVDELTKSSEHLMDEVGEENKD